jgi:hypothetical protein
LRLATFFYARLRPAPREPGLGLSRVQQPVARPQDTDVDDEVGDVGEAGPGDSDSLTLPPTPLPPPPPPPPPPPQQQAPPAAGGGTPRAAAAAGAALAVALGVFALWRAARGRRRRAQRPAVPDYGALVAAVSVPGGPTAGAAAPSPSGASQSAALPLAGTTVVLSGLCAPRAGAPAACLHLCACKLSGACARSVHCAVTGVRAAGDAWCCRVDSRVRACCAAAASLPWPLPAHGGTSENVLGSACC